VDGSLLKLGFIGPGLKSKPARDGVLKEDSTTGDREKSECGRASVLVAQRCYGKSEGHPTVC